MARRKWTARRFNSALMIPKELSKAKEIPERVPNAGGDKEPHRYRPEAVANRHIFSFRVMLYWLCKRLLRLLLLDCLQVQNCVLPMLTV
ncbi:histone H3.2-like [Macadamia integrifolia]|uniref:histone H3.2-like n=1 Tax=Macadamia integrifolia TaxID=60698 RepID=UPI001C4E87AB|nr:histone H3.2-like [Macadamia integrifolia]XP_042494073.1 histone H3.2-like [Macadamia integrifolia]